MNANEGGRQSGQQTYRKVVIIDWLRLVHLLKIELITDRIYHKDVSLR